MSVQEKPFAAAAPPGLTRSVKSFFVSALLLLPFYAVVCSGALLLVALLYVRSQGSEGLLGAVGSWSLIGLYATVGLVGGALVGIGAAARRAVNVFENELRAGLLQLGSKPNNMNFPSMTLQEIRGRYGEVAEVIEKSVGRLPLPALLHRFLISRLRKVVREYFVEDFISDCEQRGVTTVGFREICNWVAVKGLSLTTGRVKTQLGLWQLVWLGIGGLLCVVTIALALWQP